MVEAEIKLSQTVLIHIYKYDWPDMIVANQVPCNYIVRRSEYRGSGRLTLQWLKS